MQQRRQTLRRLAACLDQPRQSRLKAGRRLSQSHGQPLQPRQFRRPGGLNGAIEAGRLLFDGMPFLGDLLARMAQTASNLGQQRFAAGKVVGQGLVQTLRPVIEGLPQIVDTPAEIGQSPGQTVEAGPPFLDQAADGGDQAPPALHRLQQEIAAHRNRHFRRPGRGRRRRSEAKSISVVSVSWPTAEIRGISEAAAARTTTSSLKAHKSSKEPPPRATISKSGRGTAPPRGRPLKPSMAAAICSAAPSPCTATATAGHGAGSGRPDDAGYRGSPLRSAK